MDEDLLSCIYDFERHSAPTDLETVANWLAFPLLQYFSSLTLVKDPSNTFVGTEPLSPTDFQLLEYFKIVIKNGVAQPTLPAKWLS